MKGVDYHGRRPLNAFFPSKSRKEFEILFVVFSGEFRVQGY